MKIRKRSKPPLLNAVILTVESMAQAKLLLRPVLGEALVGRQIRQLVGAGVQELFFFLPLDDEKLRVFLKKEALKHPIKIQELNLDSKYNLWQNLFIYRHLFPEHFMVALATSLNLDYFFQQLQSWRGDVILTGVKAMIKPQQGSVKVVGKLVKTVSHQQIKGQLNLASVKVVSQKFLQFSQDKIIVERDWFEVLDQFSDKGVVKVCEFLPTGEELSPDEDDYFYRLARIFFLEGEKGVSEQAVVAGTARLRGEIIIEAGVSVGEFCVFEGPLYLGRRVKVGNFVALGPGVFVEAGSVIEAHSQLSKISLGENSLVQTVIKSKITYKL
jgi:hypothetical protein